MKATDVRLYGPFSLPPQAPHRAAREALARVAGLLREGIAPSAPTMGTAGQPGVGEAPGLYVVTTGEDAPRLTGFWVVCGPSWVESGPSAGPELVPPLVEALLEACVEEVWWALPVAAQGGAWRPFVVLEWPEELAVRAEVVPPGVAGAPALAWVAPEPEEEREAWWDEDEDAREPAPPPSTATSTGTPAPTGPRRSLVTVAVGELVRTGDVHRGRFAVHRPSADVDDLAVWLSSATSTFPPDVSGAPSPGPRLGLIGGREGYALPGWLTRGLELWPPSADRLRVGVLPEHRVGAAWRDQTRRAFGFTAAVLASVTAVGVFLRLIAAPTLYASPPAQPEATQPAMSLCSAAHRQFVDELRCQVAAMSDVEGLPTAPVCGDAGADPTDRPAASGDLQPAFCGLLDRSLDGDRPDGAASYGAVAVSEACFNVLGHPHTYREVVDGRVRADVGKLLDDPEHRIGAASDLLAELDDACALYRERMSLRVEGDVLATHVGAPAPAAEAPPDEVADLREAAVRVATTGMLDDDARCLRRGVASPDTARRLSGLCGDPDEADTRAGESKAWAALGEGEATTAIGEYARARFVGRALDATRDDLWRCWRSLVQGEHPDGVGRLAGRWGLDVAVPAMLAPNGRVAVRSQLELEAALGALGDGARGGACWATLSRRLVGWRALHPMKAGGGAAKAWPSEEQQLCGAVCAARYGFVHPGVDWLTPDADTSLCLSTSPAADARPGAGLDRLALPWSRDRHDAWVRPDPPQVCAFHLIAQGYVPDGVLGDGRDRAEWAGETAPHSGLAGGVEGDAARAIADMGRYGAGAGFGQQSCRDVAAECYLGLLLDVVDPDSGVERYRWKDAFRERILGLVKESPASVERDHPWCAPIQPYLDDAKDLAVFDSPCQRGVAAARQGVQDVADELVHGGLDASVAAAAGGAR